MNDEQLLASVESEIDGSNKKIAGEQERNAYLLKIKETITNGYVSDQDKIDELVAEKTAELANQVVVLTSTVTSKDAEIADLKAQIVALTPVPDKPPIGPLVK